MPHNPNYNRIVFLVSLLYIDGNYSALSRCTDTCFVAHLFTTVIFQIFVSTQCSYIICSNAHVKECLLFFSMWVMNTSVFADSSSLGWEDSNLA